MDQRLLNTYHKQKKLYKGHCLQNERSANEVQALTAKVLENAERHASRMAELGEQEDLLKLCRLQKDRLKLKLDDLDDLLAEVRADGGVELGLVVDRLLAEVEVGPQKAITLRTLRQFCANHTTHELQRLPLQSSSRKRKTELSLPFSKSSPAKLIRRNSARPSLHFVNGIALQKTLVWLDRLNQVESFKSLDYCRRIRHLEKLDYVSSADYMNRMALKWPAYLAKSRTEKRRLFREKLDKMSKILNEIWPQLKMSCK